MQALVLRLRFYHRLKHRKCFSCQIVSRRFFSVSATSLWKVMFFGTDGFSVESLKALCTEWKNGGAVSKLEVVTSKWNANLVRQYALEENIIVHGWPVPVEVTRGFDIGLVSSFGHLISKNIIESFPLGMLNVHASLLPRWRGASPIVHSVMHGDTETGVSIMRVRPHRFDEGEVLSVRKVVINPDETAVQLTARMAEIGAEELVATLHNMPQCLQNASPQPIVGITYAPKITPEMGSIDFHSMNAESIYNQYRALCGLYPLKTTFHGLQMRLYKLSKSRITPVDGLSNVNPGRINYHLRCRILQVQCSDGSYICIGGIGPPKKRVLNQTEFYNGYLSKFPSDKWFFGF